MKRYLALLLGLVILFLGVRAIFRALASDETKIRWKLEEIEEGYNGGDVGDTLGPIAKDWRHEDYPYDRELVRGGLIRRFFQDRHPETRELLNRVEFDYDTLIVTVEGDVATFEIETLFTELVDGAWVEKYRLIARGEWEEGPNGWFLHRTSAEDLQGTPASL